jgi:hypothetical protein
MELKVPTLKAGPALLASNINSPFPVSDPTDTVDITGYTVADDIYFLGDGQDIRQHWPRGVVQIILAKPAIATVLVTPPPQSRGFLKRLLFLFFAGSRPTISSGKLTGNLQNPKGGHDQKYDDIPFVGDVVVL